MGKYANYDEKEKVIFIDFSNLNITEDIIDQTFAEVGEIAKKLPHKVFSIACWENAKMDLAVGDYYGQRTGEALAKYLQGTVRYAANNPYSSIAIRTQTVKLHLQNSQSHIYASKEEALAAVRKLEQLEDKD